MHSMTLEQLRATASAGSVTGITLKGQGGGFFVEIATRSGQDTFLVKAPSTEPRRFGNAHFCAHRIARRGHYRCVA